MLTYADVFIPPESSRTRFTCFTGTQFTCCFTGIKVQSLTLRLSICAQKAVVGSVSSKLGSVRSKFGKKAADVC